MGAVGAAPGVPVGRELGIGDLADLRALGTWAAGRGAGMIAVNPTPPADRPGRAEPLLPVEPPVDQPLALHVEDLPGATGNPRWRRAAEARRLNDLPLLDRDTAWRHKRAALGDLWEEQGPDLRFERWREEQGDQLEDYARFCALVEHHGAGWRSWPADQRHPGQQGVAAFAAAHPDQVGFWAWLQFLADDPARPGRGAPAPADRPGHRRRPRRRGRLDAPGPAGRRRAGRRRPTSSTAPARTGACHRSCPTPCGPPAAGP